MPYMDEKDKEIQERMQKEGKVLVPNFNEIVENYYKSKYNKEGYFAFLHVNYRFYDDNYKVFNLDTNSYVNAPRNRVVKTLLPFFIEPNAIDDIRIYEVQIPGTIDVNNLANEVTTSVPEGVTLLYSDNIQEILLNEGYEEPFFDHYFYSQMDYPSYNLYARPVVKNNGLGIH